MSEKKAKIFVAHHKEYWAYKSKIFQPIHVGKKNSQVSLNMIGDDTGENISHKNPHYAELTALYWAWKNCNYYDYVGLYHYRRYLDLREEAFENPNEHTFQVSAEDNGKEFYFCNDELVKKAIKKYPIIVAKKHQIDGQSVAVNYMCCHISEDWKILMNVLLFNFPEYKNLITEAFYRPGTGLHYANMFIMTSDLFNIYMDWLFDVLSEVEKHVHITKYPYQQRVFGYMGERLLHFFLLLVQHSHGIPVKETSVVNLEMK